MLINLGVNNNGIRLDIKRSKRRVRTRLLQQKSFTNQLIQDLKKHNFTLLIYPAYKKISRENIVS